MEMVSKCPICRCRLTSFLRFRGEKEEEEEEEGGGGGGEGGGGREG